MRLSSVPFLAMATPPSGGGGGGTATWESVASTTGLLSTELAVNHPSGGTSSQVNVLVISGIESLQMARLVAPSGWTLYTSYFNLDNFGASSASGIAVYTALGDLAPANWTLTAGTGGNVNARWDMHLWSSVNTTTPVRAFALNDANTWGVDDNMPSPSATATAGDGVMAHLFHAQNSTTFGTEPSGYTRVVSSPTTNPIVSTMVRSNAPAGATGDLSHGAGGTYEARVAFTMILAAA